MKKESFYFSHDANAHIDDKILELRSEYNWEGYGIFWVLIEILRSQSDYTYQLSDDTWITQAQLKKCLNTVQMQQSLLPPVVKKG